MKILILGDVGASTTNCEAFCNAEKDLFSSEIQMMCSDADIVLLNLEKPLADIASPLGKCPPDYMAPTATIKGIKLLNPTAVTLANNHIMDQKVQGMRSTMEILAQNSIQYVGAGENLEEARKSIIIERKNCKVGIYACCEKEFSYATQTTAGANVFDPLESLDDIASLKQQCDYLIVLHHGGMQGYPYPTPYQQRVCRKMCDKGADLVVCQHSHIIGCEEEYHNSRIIYGQGNFLLDDVDSDSWRNGVILSITINDDDRDVDIIPTEVKNHKADINHNGESVKQFFYSRSREILDSQFVGKTYSEYCQKKLPDYLMKLSGVGSLRRRIINRLRIQKYILCKYKKGELYYILDYLYCDSHREAIERSVEDRIEPQ